MRGRVAIISLVSLLASQGLARPTSTPLHDALILQARAERRAGELSVAQATLSRAVERAESVGAHERAAIARRHLARVLTLMGQPEQAASVARRAEQWHLVHGPLSQLSVAKLELGSALWQWGRLGAGLAQLRGAAEIGRASGRDRVTASALMGIGGVLRQAGATTAAAEALADALVHCLAAAHAGCARRANAYRASLLLTLARHDEAVLLARRLRAEDPPHSVAARHMGIVEASAELGRGHVETARALVDQLVSDVYTASDRSLLDEIQLLRAEAAISDRDLVTARRALASARSLLTPGRRPRLTALEGSLAFARGNKSSAWASLQSYLELLEAQRQSLGELDLSGWLADDSREADHDLAVRLAVDLNRLHEGARLAARAKGRSYTELLVRAAARSPRPPALEQPPDVAILEYYVLRDETLVFVHRRGAVDVHRAPLSKRTLTDSVQSAARSVRFGRDAPVESDLLDALVTQPLAGTPTPDHIVVCPHGPLWRLPFAGLRDTAGALIERYSVSYAPNATLAARLGRRAPRLAGGRLVVVADPNDDLPAARREADDLAALHPDPTVLVGALATRANLVDALPARWLHLALHAGAGPGRSWAQLAPRGPKGHLGAREISRLPTGPVALVTLNACESDRPADPNAAGDERLRTLVRGFRRAGARSVIGARWRIGDNASRRFSELLYANLAAGAGRARALALAQRVMLQETVVSPRCRGVRPCSGSADWASFSLHGDYL